MAGLGTTGTLTTPLVLSKPYSLESTHVAILNLANSAKKSVAEVATLKPPKEDGGFFSAQFAFSRAAVGHCCPTDSAVFPTFNAFEYYYFLIT